jgi:hypothetical protein
MISLAQPQQEETPRTRCGYTPSESIRAFDKAMLESGAIGTGKALHFAADIVTSGGFESWVRSAWDYAICHIGLASPRIFVYLKKRLEEIKKMLAQLPDEGAYSLEEFQVRIGEIVLVLREAPARTVLGWPKVGAETHTEGWIRAIAAAPETAVVRKVWRPEGDSSILRLVGAELCKAISDGATEKALFWVKWLFEEEGRVRKEVKGGNLTSYDRGTPGSKQKTGVGFFILALYAETYKEFASKGLVRMHEEFQTLVDLWRGGKDIQGGAKKQILTVLTQILCEVPRWKVPAAPALIKDPVAMSQAIRQVPKFFREVLAYDPPSGVAAIAKAFRSRGKVDPKVVAKAKKGEAAEDKMSAFDKALDDYFSRV